MGIDIKNYNLNVLKENIDYVLLKLSECTGVEIRNVARRNGIIQVKATNLEPISNINEIVSVEKDTKFYINRIAIM